MHATTKARTDVVTAAKTATPLVEPLEARCLFAATAGEPDPSFGTGGVAVVTPPAGAGAELRGIDTRNGKTVVLYGGTGSQAPGLVRLTDAGKLDATFGADHSGKATFAFAGLGLASVAGFAIESDNKIVLTGSDSGGAGVVVRLKADGTPDTAFGVQGTRTVGLNGITAPVFTAEGKIVVAGSVTTTDGTTRTFAAARLTAAGALDYPFGGGGIVRTSVPGFARATAVQSNGAVVLAGGVARSADDPFDTTAKVVRLTAAGAVDPAFRIYNPAVREDTPSNEEVAEAVAIGPDGKAVVGVEGQNDLFPVRLAADGTADQVFEKVARTDSYYATVNGLNVGTDGRVSVFGELAFGDYYLPTADIPTAARYDVDGTFDYTYFAPAATPATTADTFGDLQADNKSVTAAAVADPAASDAAADGAVAVVRRTAVGSDTSGIGLASSGTLTAEGSTGDDAITVTGVPAAKGQPDLVKVSSRGVTRTYPRSAVGYVIVQANRGNDTVRVDAFGLPTKVDGGPGNDALTGGAGSDALSGGPGDDTLKGMAGDDTLVGGAGDDVLDGGVGTDLTAGGTVVTPFGAPARYAWSGYDTVTYVARTKGVTVLLNSAGGNGEAGENDAVIDVQVVVGGSGADTLNAKNVGDRGVKLVGTGGNDVLTGTAFADTLDGGGGQDRLYGMAGNDTLLGKDGVGDYLDGGAGTDKAQKDSVDALFSVESILP